MTCGISGHAELVIPITTHSPIILASGSAIRQQMLKAVGLTFRVMPSGFDEAALKDSLRDAPICEQAVALARGKALSVSASNPDSIVIGADQICSVGNKILSKPGTYENAHASLRLLSGNTHQQTSGLVLVRGNNVVWEHSAHAELTMRTLSDDEIRAYVRADAPLHSCGAYKFESLGRHLFSHVTGDHDVIKGLPLTALLAQLYALGVVTLG